MVSQTQPRFMVTKTITTRGNKILYQGIAFVLLTTLMSCLLQVPRSIKKSFTICYNPSTSIDATVLRTDGYYELTYMDSVFHTRPENAFEYYHSWDTCKERLIFFRDGIFLRRVEVTNKKGWRVDEEIQFCDFFDNIANAESEYKNFYRYGSWGIYNIVKDEIVVQYFFTGLRFTPRYNFGSSEDVYKIHNPTDIEYLYSEVMKSLPPNYKYKEKRNNLTIKFNPCKNMLSSGTAWIKKQKWLQCN
jgi:hypothetical protein